MATAEVVAEAPAEVSPAPASSGDNPIKKIWNSYLFKRIRRAIFAVWLVATLTFFMLRLMPGNPVAVYINTQIAKFGMSYDQAAAQAASLYDYDPNKSIWLQYVDYIVALLHGDMGHSIQSAGVTVTARIMDRLPWTLFSVGVAMVIAITIGLTLGMLIAYFRGGILDHTITVLGSLLHAIPNYLFALMVVVLGSVRWHLYNFASMQGRETSGVQSGFNLNFIQDIFYHASLPILTYVVTTVGTWALIMKSSTTQVLGEDYVTVARARGLSEGTIAGAYVGRNAVLPLIAQIATMAGFVVGGAIFVEQTFQYNGIGTLLFGSVTARDYPVIQGILLMITFVVIIANLIADFFYSILDPRIRTDEKVVDE